MDDHNRRERRIDGLRVLTLIDDPNLITEDDLANPWTLASLFRQTYGRVSPLAHGARIFAVPRDMWEPKMWSSLHPTTKFSIFYFLNKIIAMKIRVSNMVYWHFW